MSFNDKNQANGFIQNFKKFQDKMIGLYWKKNPGWDAEFKEFPDEKFKPIDGHQGFYFISNYGKVISFKKKVPGIRQPSMVKGFLAVVLNHFGSSKSHHVHELVYTHFIGKKKPFHRVIHKNDNINDNYYKNLKEVSIVSLLDGEGTNSDTVGPGVAPELPVKLTKPGKPGKPAKRRGPGKNKKLTRVENSKQEAVPRENRGEFAVGVLQFSRAGEFVREFSSLAEAGVSLGIDPAAILLCLKGVTRVVGGFQWRYRADPNFDDGIFAIKPVGGFKVQAKAGAAKPILQYDLEGNLIREFPSLTKAGLAAGVTTATISYSLQESGRTAGGFKWTYKDKQSVKSLD